jgi:hypothetical protein
VKADCREREKNMKDKGQVREAKVELGGLRTADGRKEGRKKSIRERLLE